MKIVPIKIKFKALYENRHLFTDDVKYNSLIISNIINMNVNLINVEYYNTLDGDSKYHIYIMNIILSSAIILLIKMDYM